MFADTGEAWAIFQRRQRRNNIVAIRAIGAASATSVAGPVVDEHVVDEYVVDDDHDDHDARLAQHSTASLLHRVHERRIVGACFQATITSVHGDPESKRCIGGQQ